MLGLENLLSGIAGGIAVEHGTDATRELGTRVAEHVGDPEHEAEAIDNNAPIWGAENTRLMEIGALDERQAAIVATISRQHRSDIQELIGAIGDMFGNALTTSFVLPLWFAAGDTIVRRSLPKLPGGRGQWRLASFTAYTDPAAAGDATLTIAVSNVLAIPFRLVATRNNPSTIAIGLPLSGEADTEITIQPAAGGGGAASDRVALLITFTKN